MEDYKYKLSIIIPMYNAEKYIANCLDSILSSDLPKGSYEVIIVNDGSADKGPYIAQEYVAKNEHFIYLTQENQGQSTARNYGIKSCNGEYVWCVDADDKVAPDGLSLFQLLKDNGDIDILAFQLSVERESGEFVRVECTQPNVQHNILMSGRDAVISGYNPSSVCALWVRKNFILDNDLFFKVGITHQDVELSYRLFANAGQVMFTDYAPYLYILHSDSTSQSINPAKKIKYLSDDIIVYQSFMALAEQKANDVQLASTITNRAQNVRFSMVYSLFVHHKEWKPLGINKAVIDKMRESGLYPLKGTYDSLKKRLAVLILNLDFLIV